MNTEYVACPKAISTSYFIRFPNVEATYGTQKGNLANIFCEENSKKPPWLIRRHLVKQPWSHSLVRWLPVAVTMAIEKVTREGRFTPRQINDTCLLQWVYGLLPIIDLISRRKRWEYSENNTWEWGSYLVSPCRKRRGQSERPEKEINKVGT